MIHHRRVDVGSKVQTAFITGYVRQIVDGRAKGWYNERYYLVAPTGRQGWSLDLPPHWVRESEIRDYQASCLS